MRNPKVEKIVKMALLCAMALVLMYLVRFPIIPALGFLEYDMADIPILLGTFMYGPWAGLILTFIVSALQAVTVSASSGFIGGVMHFLATGGFVLVAGLIYKKHHNIKGALAALAAGALTMIVLMVPMNYFLSPMFLESETMTYEVAQSMIWSMMWSFVAFNAIKAGINAVVTYIVYKPISKLFKKEFFHKKEA